MEWYWALFFCIGVLLLLFATGLPIAMGFVIFNIIGMLIFFGGESSLHSLILSMADSVTKFTLLPIPLFLLMGFVMFQTGIAVRMLETLGKMLGRVPGRLSILAVMGGTLLATMGGSTAASSSLLANTLLPEMQRRGYQKPMMLGPIMGSGVLAAIIPPSGQAVVLGSLANISVSDMLVGGILPGLVMALVYIAYIVIRCSLQPEMAPAYQVERTSTSQTFKEFLLYVLPLFSIFALTIGPIFLGIATASESAALGTAGIFVVAAAYRRLTWQAIKKSAVGAAKITTMILTIYLGASAFSQILAFSGAAGGLSQFVANLPLAPVWIHIAMLLGVIFLGMFMDVGGVMMITVPVFISIVHALHLNPLLWGISMLMCIEIGTLSPPFGIILFAVKGLVPKEISMNDIYKAAWPFVGCDLVGVSIVLLFPTIATWLPSTMVR